MFRRKTKAARCRNCDQDFGHRIPRDKPLSLCFPCAAREKLSDQMDARERALAEPEPTPVAPPPDAQDFLADALDAIASRAQERDAEGGERSMARAVDMFNAYFGDCFLSELDGWRFMMFLKLARSAGGDFNADDYVDLAGYAALAGECAAALAGECAAVENNDA